MDPIGEGERWAYRKGRLPFEEATVVKVVSQSGHRKVRVQFEDGPNAGETQWVGRQYLKAPWEQRDAFIERERRWSAAKRQAWDVPASVCEAVRLIVDEVMDDALAYDMSHGLLRTNNLALLSELTQQPESELLGDLGFEEEGFTYLPWPAMKIVAIAKCQANPAAVLDMVERDVESWGQLAADIGYYKPFSGRKLVDLEQPFPEYETQKLAWDVIRAWCGQPALSQWTALARVRADNARLSGILGRALDALERAGDYNTSSSLRREAGRAFGKTPDWIKNL